MDIEQLIAVLLKMKESGMKMVWVQDSHGTCCEPHIGTGTGPRGGFVKLSTGEED